ncbi:MAG: redoxin family protein [Planctomycetota bacterium]
MNSIGIALLALALESASPQTGPWRAWLVSPGGELPFGLEIARGDQGLRVAIVNGSERIQVPSIRTQGEEMFFELSHFDSLLRVRFSVDGASAVGKWTKRSGADRWTTLTFGARAGAAPRFPALGDPEAAAANAGAIDGRWKVAFDPSGDPAIALFRTVDDGSIEGTFLTPTGDYRYLAGTLDGDRLRLSAFDGAHAYLFDARLTEKGELAGDFYSGDRWHEQWKAKRDDRAELPDAYSLTRWNDAFGLDALAYPDLEGELRSLGGPEFAGRALVVQLFGTWCPNCHDEMAYLAELHRRYEPRGLSIVGLAFEYTSDAERSVAQVRRALTRHGAQYPVLIAGLADKHQASEAFPAIDRLRAFPTTIFIGRDGRVRGVHTGFSGPGTGAAYVELKAEFEARIEELLTSPPPPSTASKPQSREEAVLRAADRVIAARQATGNLPTPLDAAAALTDADVLVRCAAARACGERKLEATWSSLGGCLSHGFAPLRREAAVALGKLGVKASAEFLQACARDLDPAVRAAALQALQAIEGR